MKKTILIIAVLLALIGVLASKTTEASARLTKGHPIYVWNSNQTVLLDVLYKRSVGYSEHEILAATKAVTTTECVPQNERKCWGGHHVGLIKAVAKEEMVFNQDTKKWEQKRTPTVFAGFYLHEGWYYLIVSGECLEKDGCSN